MTKSKFLKTVHWAINENTRKYHYMRGFRSALIVTVPFMVVLMVLAYVLAMHA